MLIACSSTNVSTFKYVQNLKPCVFLPPLIAAAQTYKESLPGASVSVGGTPAMHTKLMQNLSPCPSGRLWPRCVPHEDIISPPVFCTTLSHIVSAFLRAGARGSADAAQIAAPDEQHG